MAETFVARARRGALAQLGRYRAEVASSSSQATIETTTLRVAITLAELMNGTAAAAAEPRPAAATEGRYEQLANGEWSLVVFLRGDMAEPVARSHDAQLAARVAGLLQAHTSGPPKRKKPSFWRLPLWDGQR